MATRQHLWTYRNGRSECIRCGATANDGRGLPHGHYAVNGKALTAWRLQAGYACPVCCANILPRIVLGELKILCAGPEAHDIERIGRAVPKTKRDYILARQEMDAVTVLDGLRGVKEMPILDLQKDATPRLKRAGVIRLGYKKKNSSGKEYPVAADHFVLKDAPSLTEIYGDKPTRLNVYLPFDEVDRNLMAWHQLWVASSLLCRGDGQRVDYAVEHQTGEVIVKRGKALATGKRGGIDMTAGHPVKCPGMDHGLYPRCEKCRPNALLIVIIPELSRLAYYQIATSSIHNIVNLTGQMRWVKQEIGHLQGVPFILELRQDSISTPGKNGNRVRRDKYLMHLEPNPEWVKAMLAEMYKRALPGGANTQRAAIAARVESAEQEPETVSGDVLYEDEPEFEPQAFDHDGDDGVTDGDFEENDEMPDFEPQPEPPTLEEARAVTTPNGTRLGDMMPAQLREFKAWFTEKPQRQQDNQAHWLALGVVLAHVEMLEKEVSKWPPVSIAAVVNGDESMNPGHAVGILLESETITPKTPADIVAKWKGYYDKARAAELDMAQAAASADKMLSEEMDGESEESAQ